MASTGMFGRPVVEGLAKRGLPVRATGRSEKGLATLDAPGAELIPADMDDPSSLLKLMNGVDKVLVNAPMDDQKEVREKLTARQEATFRNECHFMYSFSSPI